MANLNLEVSLFIYTLVLVAGKWKKTNDKKKKTI